MLILAIETSADETGVSIIKATGDFPSAEYEVLGNGLRSQIELHAQYGGIFPAMAKREHAKAVVPLLQHALDEADLLKKTSHPLSEEQIAELKTTLDREPDLAAALIEFLSIYELPAFDLVAVTNGPGLAPALWVGVNFARALAPLIGCPVIPVNHMEGHILASVFDIEVDDGISDIEFPTLALLISGGHTELVLMTDWVTHQKVGQTRDDAVGEAFDKVARLLGLPYPGGPEIERRANIARAENIPTFKNDLPRPMLHSDDLDFSFSGLKTAVRYAVQDQDLSESDINAVARDFSDAVVEVLLAKTKKAAEQHGVQTIIVGGGVSASQFLREEFQTYFNTIMPEVTVYFPHRALSTDNSVMIALAGHAHVSEARTARSIDRISADSNRSL